MWFTFAERRRKHVIVSIRTKWLNWVHFRCRSLYFVGVACARVDCTVIQQWNESCAHTHKLRINQTKFNGLVCTHRHRVDQQSHGGMANGGKAVCSRSTLLFRKIEENILPHRIRDLWYDRCFATQKEGNNSNGNESKSERTKTSPVILIFVHLKCADKLCLWVSACKHLSCVQTKHERSGIQVAKESKISDLKLLKSNFYRASRLKWINGELWSSLFSHRSIN